MKTVSIRTRLTFWYAVLVACVVMLLGLGVFFGASWGLRKDTGLPFNFSITGFTSLSENYNKEQVGQSISANDTVSWTRGDHTLKFGAELKLPRFNEQNSVDEQRLLSMSRAFLPTSSAHFSRLPHCLTRE